MNDLEASIGLEGIANFWKTFDTRYINMKRIMVGLSHLKNELWFSEEDKNNKNCPHGISMTVKVPGKIHGLKEALDKADIHWKRNFGCSFTQHDAFRAEREKDYYNLGCYPEAEYVGDYGIHIGCHQYLTEENINRIITTVSNYFK
jgi:dTDP-4-amino-4,6-dideoxygalactose transaminase